MDQSNAHTCMPSQLKTLSTRLEIYKHALFSTRSGILQEKFEAAKRNSKLPLYQQRKSNPQKKLRLLALRFNASY